MKDYLKERHKVITYFEIGKILNEAGKKYNRRSLLRMKQFYNVFSNQKVSPLVTQLNWSNCRLLIHIKDINIISYYALQVINRNLSNRQLQEIIKNKEYERLPEETKNKLIFIYYEM